MAWDKLLLIGFAGGLGAIVRFFLSRLVSTHTGETFPWGTLTVNVAGCLLFGLLWGMGEDREWFSDRVRLTLLIGFLGAFTTFSSFAYETVTLIRDQQYWWAGCNIAAQNILGIAAVLLGIGASRIL